MRNLLFASVRDGNLGAENIWMVYKSDTASLLTFSATELDEAKEYALTPERTVYRKDRKQVAYVNKAVIMGRGKAGVALVLAFDAGKESGAQRYAAEIIGAPCPAWLNMDTVVTTRDAEKYLSAPNVYDDWVSRSEVARSFADRNAVLALIDAIVKGAKRPILLYSSRSGGDVSIPSEVDTVLKTALLSLPVAIANGISFSTYTELERDLNGMDVVCVSGHGMEVNAAWKEQYTAIDIADVAWQRSTFYGKLVEKYIRSRKNLLEPLSDLTNMADLEREAAKEFFHATLGEMAETCATADLYALHELYLQSDVRQNQNERKILYLQLSKKQVVADDGNSENALIYWLEAIESLLPVPAPQNHCDLSRWEQGYKSLNELSSELGAIVIEEFRRLEESFIESVSTEDLKDASSKEESDQFYPKAKKLGFLDLDEMFREKFIVPRNPVVIGEGLELAKKYFHCSENKTKAEFCDMLFKADMDWYSRTGEAVALLSWMRADFSLPEKILDGIPNWISAKQTYEGYCTEEQKGKLNALLLEKCENELIPLLGTDPIQCKGKWEKLKQEKPDVGRIEAGFGFRVDAYEKRCRKDADGVFRKAYKSILEEPDSAAGKISEARQKYKCASDEVRKAGYQALFKDPERRAVAADCVMEWEELPQEVKTISVLTKWKKALQYLKNCLEKQYSEQAVVLSIAFKDMCSKETAGAKSSLNVWIEIVKTVEGLTNEKLIREEDGEEIKKYLFGLCDQYFERNWKGARSISPAIPERESVYRDLIEYGYSGNYKTRLQEALDFMRYRSVEKGLQTSCDVFYGSIKEWDPDAEEETGVTKAARRKERFIRVVGIGWRFIVWLGIVAAGVALISVLSPLILKWSGIADTVDIALSVMHLQFLNAPIAWGGLAAMVYLLTSIYHCVMHEKSMDGWQVIGKSSRNMICWVLIPYAAGFVALLLIFVL